MLETYGDVALTFSSYYKYSFTFTGTAPDGNRVVGWYGGNADDIYRFEVANDSPQRARDMDSFEVRTTAGELVGEYECDSW